jgi:DNA-directed RNA polymerase subunit alpha
MAIQLELMKPTQIQVEEESYSPTYGKFTVQPLERGYGITLGNALRRVLLSSIPGTAITAVEIEGAPHEFTSLPDVREDVTEIILNLKGVRLKSHRKEPEEILLDVTGPKVAVAGDFRVPHDVEIINPDHIIAHVEERGHLRIRATIEKGRGFWTSEELKRSDVPIGTIFVDALFSPIRRVNFEVGHARVGQRTDYDKLTLEITTDGSITPKEALTYAARILQDQFQVFLFTGGELRPGAEKQPFTGGLDPRLLTPVEDLNLSNRTVAVLQANGVQYLGDLVQLDAKTLLTWKNFGEKSLEEVEGLLKELGMELGTNLPDWERIRPQKFAGV